MIKKRSFYEYQDYDLKTQDSYFLMPFNFHNINEDTEVLINLVGDFILAPKGTARKVISREISEATHLELYGDLIANFFISEEPTHPLIDVLATKYRTKKAFLDRFTALHIFVISLRCEHTCEYCQVSRVTPNKEAFDMKIAHLEKGVDHMMQSPSKSVTMEFQGGEPLLAFELLQHGVHYAKEEAQKRNKNISFVICSNLALINEKMLEFCKEHNILLSTSLDGPEFIHNKNRRRPTGNSYELLKKGLALSREMLGEENIGALMTTSKLALDFPIEIIDNYLELGFNNIFLRPISPYGFAKKNVKKSDYEIERYLNFYKKGLDYILDLNKNGTFLIEDYAAILLKKIFSPFTTGYVDLQSPAGLINSVIVFNYDGSIYATDESRMLAEMNDFTFKLGHLDTSSYEEIFYGEKTQEISKFWLNENLPGCSDCAFQSYCGADPVYNYSTQGNLVGHRPTSGFCKRNMEIIRYLFELMADDKDVERIFRTWIN